MFAPGFFGTRAPFFMDLVTLAVALLPLLLWLGILWARRGFYGLHRIYQWLLFWVAAVVVGWFEYGARAGGGFRSYLAQTSLSPRLVTAFLVLHILIAVVTMVCWVRTLWLGEREWRRGNLPGGYSLRHIRGGRLSAWGIFLTSLTGIWIYLLLFVF